jgi:hypothetical protein
MVMESERCFVIIRNSPASRTDSKIMVSAVFATNSYADERAALRLHPLRVDAREINNSVCISLYFTIS